MMQLALKGGVIWKRNGREGLERSWGRGRGKGSWATGENDVGRRWGGTGEEGNERHRRRRSGGGVEPERALSAAVYAGMGEAAAAQRLVTAAVMCDANIN